MSFDIVLRFARSVFSPPRISEAPIAVELRPAEAYAFDYVLTPVPRYDRAAVAVIIKRLPFFMPIESYFWCYRGCLRLECVNLDKPYLRTSIYMPIYFNPRFMAEIRHVIRLGVDGHRITTPGCRVACRAELDGISRYIEFRTA